MFEESVWASMNSWFTPTVLFVFLNLMIGTIVISSSLASKKPNNPQPQHHDHQNHHSQSQSHPQLGRSPSVLQRLKSINFYSYTSPEPAASYFLKPPAADQDQIQTTAVRSPSSVVHRLNSTTTNLEIEQPQPDQEEDEGQPKSIDDIYRQLKAGNHGHVGRSTSDTGPAAEEAPPLEKPRRKMKKSASAKSAFSHPEDVEAVEARRPATVREVRVSEENDGGAGDDEEVDAKADDFINRFKQQLKLQRLDSLIGRGTRK